ncbi:enkurin [Aplysia californica]|uniref:Enkurin n=1 Tax=Aplysia californica TaxID=6500 RepID=A0ABM0K8I4_APLCA|nr:enkurin [Aplysia californica]
MFSNDEPTIYNLLTVEETKEKKPKAYTSKFRQNVKQEYTSGRGGAKTMGPAKVTAPQPTDYLKKHEKEPQLPKKEEFKYPDDNRKKPSVPKNNDTPLMGLKTTKNFISTNAVENITAVPKLPAKKFADTRNGDVQNLIPSGYEPVFVHKKDFGEVPMYLTKRKEEVARAQEEYDQYISEQIRRTALRQLTYDERQAIIDGLKANWEDIQDQYQGLSVVTDTAPKKNRKERMEAQMKQLERDIELFEKHKVIYIGN